MSISSRKEYLVSIYKRYRFSSRKEKKGMLNEFCRATGHNRKYAIRILNLGLRSRPCPRKGRALTYTNEDVFYLKKIWQVLDYPCGQRLKPMVLEMILVLERCQELTFPSLVKEHLEKMSSKTMDRRLSLWEKERGRRLRGTTRPGSLLKKQIPIVLSRWNETQPGYAELDLVAHCGNSAQGDFISTLNLTDLATGWTEQEAILGKAQIRVKGALSRIAQRLPFVLLGIDPDNGSEFINWQLFRYCLEKEIIFTRGRPTKKNDNAHIEQKNWTHVRKIIGYSRLETEEELGLLNDLYRNSLCLYMNFFQPVMKLVRKERVEGRLKRVYDLAKTPYQRALDSKEIPQSKKQELRNLYQTLNPVLLKREIGNCLNGLLQLVEKRTKEKCPKVTFQMSQRIPVGLHFQMT